MIVYVYGVYSHGEYNRLDLKRIDDKIRMEMKNKKKRN